MLARWQWRAGIGRGEPHPRARSGKRGVELIQALEGRILDELEGLSKPDAALAAALRRHDQGVKM